MKKLLLFLTIALTGATALAQGWPANYGGVMLQGFFWDSYKEVPDCSPFGPEGNRTYPAGVQYNNPGMTWATMYGAGWATGEEWLVPKTTWSSLLNCGTDITRYIDLLWLPQSGSTVCGPTITYYKSNDNSGRGGVRAWRNGGTWGYNDGNIITNPDCMGFVPVFYFHHGLVKNPDNSDWTYNFGNTTYTPMSYHGTEAELRQLINTFKAAGTGAIEDVVINHRGGLGTWSNDKNSIDFPSEYYNNELIQWTSSDVCSDDESGRGTGNPDCGGRGEWARDMDHHSAATRAKMAKFLDFLKNDLGYIGFRYDYAMGFEERHFGDYNTAVRPAFSVGEYWGSQDNIKTWIKNTYADGAVQSAAFDFPLMGYINDAFNNGNYRGLKGAGLISDDSYKRYAVTFIDNHDTFKDLPTDGSNYAYQHRLNNHIVEANAFILSMPGTPCLFWPHYKHPTWKAYIQDMIIARRVAGVTNTSNVVETNDVDNNGVEFKIQGNNGKILLQLGDAANASHVPGNDYTVVYTGDVARMSIETTALNGQSWNTVKQNYTKTTLAMGYPVVDKPSGSYYGGVTVNVAPSSPGVELVYSTNGTEPTANSTKITSATALTFNTNTTLKVGVLCSGVVSNVITRAYITDHKNYVEDKITIFVRADDEPNFYMWRESSDGSWEANLNGNWPGGKSDGTKYIDGIKWYYKTVDPVASDKLLCLQLNWGTDQSKQSDIRGITNDVFYTLAGNIPTDATHNYVATVYGSATSTEEPLDIDKVTGEYEGYVQATISGGSSATKIIYCVDHPDVELTASTTANSSNGTYVVNGAGPVTVTFDASNNTNDGKRTHTLNAILVKNGQIIDSQERTYWISGTLINVPSGINIYVKNMTTNEAPHIVAWAGNTALTPNFDNKGDAMTLQNETIAGQTWYKWHTDNTNISGCLFMMTGTKDQTSNFESFSGEGDYFFYYYPGAHNSGHDGFINVTSDPNRTTTTKAITVFQTNTDNAGFYAEAQQGGPAIGSPWSGKKSGECPKISLNNRDWYYITYIGYSSIYFQLVNKGNTNEIGFKNYISSDQFFYYPKDGNNWSNYWPETGTSVTQSPNLATVETPEAYVAPTQNVVINTPQMQLSDLALTGNNNTKYIVANDLFVEMVNTKSNTLFARTDRGAAYTSTAGPNQTTYDDAANFQQDDWVEIQITGQTLNANDYQGKAIVAGTLNGTFTMDGMNKKIATNYVPLTSTARHSEHTTTNNYLVANFLTPTERGNIFFVDPQPNEVAKLKYAVFRGGKLYMHNDGIKGITSEVGISYDTDYYVNGTFNEPTADPETGVSRGFEEMTVIVKKSGTRPATSNNGPRRADSPSSGNYTIQIAATSGPTTGVEDITDRVADRHVTAVRYYNLMGVASDKPFDGLNIIVTYFDDGSHTVVKQLR